VTIVVKLSQTAHPERLGTDPLIAGVPQGFTAEVLLATGFD